MEYIRVAKARFSFHMLLSEVEVPETSANVSLPMQVEGVTVLHRGRPTVGTLHLTPHHLIFRSEPGDVAKPSSDAPPQSGQQKPAVRPREIWITYPIISTLFRYPANASAPAHLRLRNRDFSFLTLQFKTERECRDVFESVKALAVVREGVEKLYAFSYCPGPKERKANGWGVYDPLKEYERMGIGTERCKGWRISKINKDYTFSPTYPALLVVPATISDTTLSHAKNYRSRMRIPALTYIHPLNNCSITRCSQPLTGVRGNRSIQDEKLVAAIFASSQPQNVLPRRQARPDASSPSPSGSSTNLGGSNLEIEDGSMTSSTPEVSEPPQKIYGAQQNNLIVDARPTVNAYAMQALGMGSENMENYRHLSSPPCTKTYLGIENIHVMRDCLQKVVEAIKDSDISPLPPNREMLVRSGWTKHIGVMLDGTLIIVRQIALEHSHVLIHCSDGWDRTSQLSSLAQICLDPYFRTIDGFIALVEKDWVSFGYRFRDRCGFLGSEKWFVEKSGNGPAAEEEAYRVVEDDGILPGNSGGAGPFASVATAGGGLGEALEKGFGQAKMFFNTTVGATASNGGRMSNVNSSSELLESDSAEAYHVSPPTVDRKTKIANASPTPVSVTKPKEVSPVFHQFLDATYQLMQQNPTRFEYNERFLRRLLYHLYSCQYGTFLHNNDKERAESRVRENTRSVWDYFLLRRSMWINEKYDPLADGRDRERDVGGGRVLFPKTGGAIKWWEEVWGRDVGEMNGTAMSLGAGAEVELERSRTPTFSRGGESPASSWLDKAKEPGKPMEVEMM